MQYLHLIVFGFCIAQADGHPGLVIGFVQGFLRLAVALLASFNDIVMFLFVGQGGFGVLFIA